MSVVNNLFRSFRGHTDVPGINPNTEFTTGRSRLRGGEITLDPALLEQRGEARGIVSDVLRQGTGAGERFSGQIGDIRSRLQGGRGAFIQARVNPLLQSIATQRGQLQRRLGQTGVMGTFAQQARRNLELDAERALADERARAEQDLLQAELGLAGTEFEAGRSLRGEQLNVGQLLAGMTQQDIANELAQLGLSSEVVLSILRANQSAGVAKDQAREAGLERFGSFITGLGGFF